MKRKLLSLLLVCVILMSAMALFTACGEEEPVYSRYVAIEVENFGTIVVELYKIMAPGTVYNFQKLVSQGFYDGLTFHRVIEGFMIQGGCPKGDGTGNAGYNIHGEMMSNGFSQNTLKHTRGTISMARGSHSMDSASCQFFICDADSTFLDGDYAAFGKVVEGMDMVDEIAGVSVSANLWGEMSDPNVKVVIQSIRRVEGSENKVVMKVKIGG